ncbi:MAG: DUF1343 domain-containing protein [Planctomycetes bacterium]|nr:DUF1343 domain-containing protein [Planctomycetota bacterium]
MRRLLAFALVTLATSLPAQVRTGVDVLAASGCAELAGRKIGLITNHTGLTRDGRRTIDVIAAAADCQLVALFSPEHGIQGKFDAEVADSSDARTGLPIYSLYGETRSPTDVMLNGIDTLVFDIQDIGCRFYTYVSTLRRALEAAAAHGLRCVVLDRPNPIGGVLMAGPIAAADRLDFVAAHRVPLRHGMTPGELAKMMCGEDGIAVDLQVIACTGWQRADLFFDTGLTWVNPSPNMRCLTQAMLYPGVGIVEGTNVSVGRGTDTPFEVLGAPWCDGPRLAAELDAAGLPGVRFVPIRFTPASSRHKDQECSGINLIITDWRRFESVRTGIHIACALHRLHGEAWDTARLDWLLKHAASTKAILAGEKADDIVAGWRRELDLFRMRRKPFLLYE